MRKGQKKRLWTPSQKLEIVKKHLVDQRFGCEEHTIVRSDVLSKFIEEVLVDPAQDIAAHLIQCAVVENTQQLRKDLIGEHGIVLRQDTNQLLTLLFDQSIARFTALPISALSGRLTR